jgi:BASS family bile acid:Na+ symporter
MGITLRFEDFRNVIRNWRYVLVGFIAQYTLMPSLAVAAACLFRLPEALRIGLILVGCSPGGTASNVVAMIAQADVALSVLMTMASTVAAVAITPLLISAIVGSSVQVSVRTKKIISK